MDSKCVHHVEFGVRNGLNLVNRFLKQFRFRLLCSRQTPAARQWLVCSHAIRFLITELLQPDIASVKNDPYITPWFSSPSEVRDSVFNVALRVKNINHCVQRLSQHGVEVTKRLRTFTDEAGSVHTCTIKSCVGNVHHTLVDDSNYSGVFLPGFQSIGSVSDVNTYNLTFSPDDLYHIDHVTFCCPVGASANVIQWYERCLGMKRFLINSNENKDEGFVISGKDIGMRLKAFEYWKCAEMGISMEETAAGSVKFVVAEALPNQGPNQVGMFIKNHGGPGVQHIGLHTGDIVGAVTRLQDQGVQFNEPPYTYYTEVGRLKEMITIGMDANILKSAGILLDTEADSGVNCKDDSCSILQKSNPYRYLMQKFTRPLFEKDTFFLEVIQRTGATGFGSGNITALWRSVQAYFQSRQHGQEKSDNI